MANITITGTVFWNTLPKAGVTVYARIEKTGEVQFTEAQRVATSDAAGLVTFDLPQSCIAYIEGEFQCGATNFDVPGGVALTIPAAASATLESLSAAVTFPSTGAVVQDDGVALANPISTFNFGTGLTATESSPGVALLSAAVVSSEDIQDALVNFFPDVAPFDWTYDDANNRVTLNILDATSSARGLMSTAYAARLDQLEVGDSPTFAGLTLSGILNLSDSTTAMIRFGGNNDKGIYHDSNILFQSAFAGLSFKVWNGSTYADQMRVTGSGIGINKSSSIAAQLHVLSNAIGVIPLIAEGPAGQTANLFEARVNGANKFAVGSASTVPIFLNGNIYLDTNWYYARVAGASAGFRLGSGNVVVWSAGTDGGGGSADTSLSRTGAGVVQVGTGGANASGKINAAEHQVAGVKIVGAQGAAVADATDNPSAIARLNDLLARLRTHGLIAT